MKHHKTKGVWSHKPDALPLEDAPSTGTKRKKGPLARLSKKHLWDLLRQQKRVLEGEVGWLFIRGVPDGSNAFETDMAVWLGERIEKGAEDMDGLIKELEGRMG